MKWFRTHDHASVDDPHSTQTRTPVQSIFSPRFFLGLFVVVSFALFAMNTAWFLPSLRTISDDALDRQIRIAQRARAAILQFLEYNELRLAAAAQEIRPHQDVVRQRLERFLANNPDFHRIAYIDAEGKEQARVEQFGFREVSTADRSQELGVSTALAGQSYFGPIFFTRGEPLHTVITPVSDLYGRRIGVLEVDLTLRGIWEMMAELQRESQYHVYLTDGRGNLIADPDPSAVLRGENVLFRPVVRTLVRQINAGLAGREAVVRQEYLDEDSREIFSIGIPLERLDWGIFVEQPTKDVFKTWTRVVVIAFFALGVVIILLSIIGWATRHVVLFARAMNREREHVSSLITNLTTGLIEYNERREIILINPAIEGLLDVWGDEIVGTQVQRSWLKKEGKEFFAHMFFDTSGKRVKERVYLPATPHTEMITLPQTMERNVRVTTLPITTSAGKETTYLKVIQDVTEEQLIARMKSEFITIAAHQLRTPLSAIKWTFSLLLDGDLGALNKKQRALVSRGFGANDNMIHIINGLLDVSRIEEGRFGFTFIKSDVIPLLEKIIDGKQIEFEQKKIKLSLTVAKNIPQFFFDPDKLSLAMINVIENALHYTREGGLVTVSIRKRSAAVIITVTDTGIGISEEDMKLLFGKFFRGANALLVHTNGSGLGLFITRNIILSHGGDIQIDSKLDKGTSVSITLPLHKKKPGSPAGIVQHT